jgi:hypothetical protein
MGKQVRFYALPDDEKIIWDFVRTIPDTFSIVTTSTDSTPKSFFIYLDTSQLKPIFREYFISLGNPDALIPYIRKAMPSVYNRELMDFVKTGEIFYRIDTDAPVIEFSSSFFQEDGKLAQGRIWADLYRLEKDQFIYKGDEFKDLYETLAKWIRNHFKKLKGVDGYFGKEALEWYQKGGIIH